MLHVLTITEDFKIKKKIKNGMLTTACCHYQVFMIIIIIVIGVMNGPLKFLTACKILPLLDLLAKFKRVLACLCSPNFCSGLQARKANFLFLLVLAKKS